MMKTKTASPHHGVWSGLSDDDVMPPSIFPHGLRLNNGGLHQVPGEGNADLD